MTLYNSVYIGSGPIMMLDALNSSLNSKYNIMIIDKESELGGAWKSIKLFGDNEVENAVHYLLPNEKGYKFIAKNFNISYENCHRKFYALNIMGLRFMLKVNNLFGKIIYLLNGGDQAEIISFEFLMKLFFNKSKINKTKYPKEGMLYVVKRISKKIINSKVKLRLNENIEEIIIDKDVVTLKTNKNIYKTKKLFLSHGFIPCKIILHGKELEIKKNLNHRPSLHIITKKDSAINKKFFNYSQVLFPKGSLVKYVHQISQFQDEPKQNNQQIIVTALNHSLIESEENYHKVATLLEKYECIPKSDKRHKNQFYWRNILIPQIKTKELLKLSSRSGNKISFLETECLNNGIGKYSDKWDFPKNFFYK